MAKLLKGAPVAAALSEQMTAEVDELKRQGINPTLAVLRVGERADDLAYERGAMKRCESIGISVKSVVLESDVTQDKMLSVIDEANEDANVHGVLLLRPLPKHLDSSELENRLRPEKDVDCMTDL